MFHHIPLQRRLPIDQRRHDIAVLDVFAVFQNHEITIQNMSVDHGIAPDPQRKSASIF